MASRLRGKDGWGRVAPAEAGEAAEVGVVGLDLSLMLHGDSGDVAVGHQISADSCGGEVSPEVGQVVGSGIYRGDVGELEPLVHVVNGLPGGSRAGEHFGVSHQPYEARRHHPQGSYSLCAVDQVFSPAPGGVVQGSPVVVGVDEQIEVGDNHRALGSAKSSASN